MGRSFNPDFVVRRPTTLPDFSTVDVSAIKFREHPDFSGLKVFTCDRLNAVLTADSCAKNYTREKAPESCRNCPIGRQHARGDTERGKLPILNDKRVSSHVPMEAAMGPSCIRCGRDNSTAKRYVGLMRLVQKRTVCVSCANRSYEVAKGLNSKNATPVKWNGLKETSITIKLDGKLTTLNIGLRSGRPEVERYVERVYPGAKLVECVINGEIVKPGTPALVESAYQTPAPKTLKTRRKPKALPVASARDFLDDEPVARAAPPDEVEPVYADEPTALESDEDPILDFWPAFEVNAKLGLAPFVAWLTEDWPEDFAWPASALQPGECVEMTFFGTVVRTQKTPVVAAAPAVDTSVPEHQPEPVKAVSRKRGRTWLPAMSLVDALAYERSFDRVDAQPAGKTAGTIAPNVPAAASRVQDIDMAAIAWAGKTLTEWSAKIGEPVDVLANRLVEHGTPFPNVCKAVRPPPPIASATPLAEVAASTPSPIEPQPVVKPVATPQAQKPVELLRIFHPALRKLGFAPATLYSVTWMPLAVDTFRGPGKTTVLAGCLCGKTAVVNAVALLKGNVGCDCGIKVSAPVAAPSHDLVALLRLLKAPAPVRLCLSTTRENAIRAGTRAFISDVRAQASVVTAE